MANQDDFNFLKDTDIYSLAMFILYKLSDIKEFSIISELAYILDKQSLLNLCKYFGGRTIKIPTLSELDSIMHLILLYRYVEIDKIEYQDAVKQIGFKSSELRKVKIAYSEMKKILSNYKFNRGSNE